MRNPLTGVERALFWTLAFAAFAAAAAGLAARAVDRVAADYESSRAEYAIVRVLAPEGAAGMAVAQSILAQAAHVHRAVPMTAERAAALLGEWAATDVAAPDLPQLHLIEVELAHVSPDADVAGDLEAALAESGVTADVIAAPDNASGAGLAGRVRAAAFWGAVAFALVMAVIISLAARTLAARRREMVTVMCDLGVTRSRAAGQVADEAAVLGLYAGLAGGLLAGIGALVVLWLAIPGMSLEALRTMILPIDLAPIVAAPLVAAIAAGGGARAAASYFHGQAARLG